MLLPICRCTARFVSDLVWNQNVGFLKRRPYIDTVSADKNALSFIYLYRQ